MISTTKKLSGNKFLSITTDSEGNTILAIGHTRQYGDELEDETVFTTLLVNADLEGIVWAAESNLKMRQMIGKDQAKKEKRVQYIKTLTSNEN